MVRVLSRSSCDVHIEKTTRRLFWLLRFCCSIVPHKDYEGSHRVLYIVVKMGYILFNDDFAFVILQTSFHASVVKERLNIEASYRHEDESVDI